MKKTFLIKFLAITLGVFACSLPITSQAGILFPPANIGDNPNVKCPNGQVLNWTGQTVECADPTPGVTISCPPGQTLTGVTNGIATCSSILPQCTPRYSTSAIKGPCGAVSTVMCGPGEFALNGGIIASNDSAQSSAPVYDNKGMSVGWTISVLNDGTSPCAINDYNTDGAVAGGSQGNPPSFSIGNGAHIEAQAVATCCMYPPPTNPPCDTCN